uniref:Kelch repeat and BTB (POZ) domain containing 6 n=1 Tax=Cricetulus griseus TaxID=10029 RepID=A0A8C2LBG0_CRIGR
MQSREDAPRSRRLASSRGGRRPKRISKPSVSAFFTGPEELKDAAHSAALLAQLKSFYDARLLCDVTIEVVTPGSGPGTGRMGSIREETLADLTLAQLLAVLRLDSLDVDSEKTVCHVAVQWLEAAPKERGPSAAEVFKCVRWAHFPAEDQDYLEGLLTKPIVKKYCQNIIEGALLQLRSGDGLQKSLVNSNSNSNSNSSNNKSTSSTVVPVEENPPHRLSMCAKRMIIFEHHKHPFLYSDPYFVEIYKVPSPLTFLAHNRIVTTLSSLVSPDHDICLCPAQERPKLKEVKCYSVQRNRWALVAQLLDSFISFD